MKLIKLMKLMKFINMILCLIDSPYFLFFYSIYIFFSKFFIQLKFEYFIDIKKKIFYEKLNSDKNHLFEINGLETYCEGFSIY
jgi:hypothetical protein